jgi:hypothetical protein
MKRGNYFGTEVGGKWWKRYREAGFFARGNGEFDLDATGISFRRKLTQDPLVISWYEISTADLGKWHAGRWAMGHPILRVEFVRDGQTLCAGFLLSREWSDMETLAAEITQRATQGES